MTARKRKKGFRWAAIAAAASAGIVFAIAGGAFADNTVADGDGVAPVGDNDMAFGAVNCNQATQKSALIAIRRLGAAGSTNVFKDGSTVTISVQSVSGAGLSAVMGASTTITLPSDWATKSNGTLSDSVSSTVTVNSSTAGPGSGSVTYRATGVNSSNATLTRDDVMNVSWTTGSCVVPDATAPDSGSISINDGAAWTSNTGVSVDISAHDAVGVSMYRLAESQLGLDSASDQAVSPAEVNFSRNDVAFSLSGGDAAAKAVWVRFYDAAGNYSDASDTIGLDTVKPVITGSTGSYVPGTWTNQNVVVSFGCADNAGAVNSGIASNTVAGATLSSSGADQSVTNSGACSDSAGNVADSATVSNIDIDKDAPTVSCNAASFLLNQPNAQVSASITDQANLSGPLNATEYGSANTSTVGSKSVSITGYDNAGNSASKSCAYTVGYNFDGLYAPVDKPNTLNVSKAGQAIPMKWRLTDYFGVGVASLTSASVTVASLSCTATSGEDAIEEYASGSSGLQNLGDGYYQFNWKTPTNYANSCKQIGLNLGEGSPRNGLANFNFKK